MIRVGRKQLEQGFESKLKSRLKQMKDKYEKSEAALRENYEKRLADLEAFKEEEKQFMLSNSK